MIKKPRIQKLFPLKKGEKWRDFQTTVKFKFSLFIWKLKGGASWGICSYHSFNFKADLYFQVFPTPTYMEANWCSQWISQINWLLLYLRVFLKFHACFFMGFFLGRSMNYNLSFCNFQGLYYTPFSMGKSQIPTTYCHR